MPKWNSFFQSYLVLGQVRIPRWVSFRPEFRVKHHGFCDASLKAHGTVTWHTKLATARGAMAMVKIISAGITNSSISRTWREERAVYRIVGLRGVVLESPATTGEVPEQQLSKAPSARNAEPPVRKGERSTRWGIQDVYSPKTVMGSARNKLCLVS